MVQAQKSEDEAPAWAPLRDNYMLANPKLKDWDKKQVSFSFVSTDLEPPGLSIYTLCLKLGIEMSAGNNGGR